MKRKTFLKTIALGAATGATGLSLTECALPNPNTGTENLDALSLAELVKKKILSPLELLEQTISKIELINPGIGCVSIKDFEPARARALKIDTNLPFAGVPLLLKDGTDFGEMLRPHSSKFFAQYKSKGKSPIVKRYEELGFNVIGYSRTPEFNNMAGTTEPTLFGPCRNPWNTQRSVGASSGGASASVASDIVPLAHGTDGGGSLRIPASYCGTFGFKPSQYRMLSGQLDGLHNHFTEHHVVTKTVRDSAHLFYHAQNPIGPLSPLSMVKGPSSTKLRIGWQQVGFSGSQVEGEITEACEKAATLLKEMGHSVVVLKLPVQGDEFFQSYFVLFGQKMKALIQAVEQVTGKRAEDTGLLEPWTIAMARNLEQFGAKDIEHAHAKFQELSIQNNQMFNDVDVIMSPVTPTMSPLIGEIKPDLDFETMYRLNCGYMDFTVFQNIVQSTAMSVPLYKSQDGMPIGIHFSADIGQENRLLELAYALEESMQFTLSPSGKS